MIRMEHGSIVVECDDCGRESDDLIISFEEAHEWKRDNEWGSEHHETGWRDLCPDCVCKRVGF